MLIGKEAVILPAEDRTRMSRLYEEVRIRLEEMAMITTRTLKIRAGHVLEIKFHPFASWGEVEFEAVELVRTPQGYGCYDYRQGSCFESEGAGSEDLPHFTEEGRYESPC
jgi:hypothetical protein